VASRFIRSSWPPFAWVVGLCDPARPPLPVGGIWHSPISATSRDSFRGMITEEVLPTIEGWREILVAGLFALQLPNPARLSDNHIPRWRSNGKSPASL